MFNSINRKFRAAKQAAKDRATILEAVLGVEEVLPGSEEEIESTIDVDSVPDDAYNKLDAALDKIVDDPNYDDTEADEMMDGDDFDEDDISDEELDAIINETCAEYLDA